MYQFYRGLPPRIKDRISEGGKPDKLHKLRELAQSIDHRYWECTMEQNRDSAGDKPSPQTTMDPASQPPDPGSDSGSDSNSDSNSSLEPWTSAMFAKYDKKTIIIDGKLTLDEHQRHYNNNLCFFCGNSRHSAAACPKRLPSGAKARAASITAPDDGASEVSVPSEN